MADDHLPREALELVHHHPGRLRLRATTFERDDVVIVRERLDTLLGILEVTHAKATGSLLITYEPGIVEPDEIIVQVADAAELDPPREKVRDPRKPALVAIGVGRELNAAVEVLTGHRADLRSIVPAAMAGLAAYAWMQQGGQRLPRWDNLLYWSYNIFIGLHRKEIDESARVSSPTSPPSPSSTPSGAKAAP